MSHFWSSLKSNYNSNLFHGKVEQTRITVRESGVQLNLTCVDTPGFGDEVNNDNSWEPIIEFIEQQFELYLNAESRVDRPHKIQDTRVHCCLYFIAPTGHGLKPLDVEFMRRLHNKVRFHTGSYCEFWPSGKTGKTYALFWKSEKRLSLETLR
jgi:septin family protein